MQCKRHRNEDLKAFVARLRSLDTDHLMHVRVSTLCQAIEVLAITLLNHDILSEEALTNVTPKRVALAECRKQVEIDLGISINC